MRKLAVAHTAEAIDPTFAQSYTEGRPGFQIGPDVSVIDCLAILQNHVRTRLGMQNFAFNAGFGSVQPEGAESVRNFYFIDGNNDAGPHIDESYARRKLGIALHHNVHGVGKVVLRQAKPGLSELDKDEIGRAVIHRRDTAGPPYEGVLEPAMKTVFYEGFTAANGLVAVTMGASIHDFRSTGPIRGWTRYSWEPTAPVA